MAVTYPTFIAPNTGKRLAKVVLTARGLSTATSSIMQLTITQAAWQTKTAQVALARGIAETTIGSGVTVNSVLPGPTLSEGVGTFLQQLAKERGLTLDQMEKQFFETARPSSLIKRFI